MKYTTLPLPSLAKVESALRKTTEHLALELASPTDVPPTWSDFEWHVARAASAVHGVSSLLYNGLRWQGPESWRRLLYEQRHQSIGRHEVISKVLEAIDSQSRSEGVALLALKGAALYAGGIYSGGERPMGDIDLLGREADSEAIVRVLEACGYTAAFTTHRHRVF